MSLGLGLTLCNSGLVLGSGGGGAPFANTKSLSFDGVDDYVDVGSINLGNTFTLSAWVKLNGFSSTQNILFGGGVAAYAMYIPNNTTIYFNFGSGYALFTVPTILTSTYYNIIFTRNGSNGELFINGISQGTTTALGANNFTVNFLGCENQGVSTKYYFNGNIDEPCIFNRVVTAAEIATLSTAPTVDLTDLNPIAWYRNGDNGSWKSPQWLIPNNENFAANKVSNYSFEFDGVNDYIDCGDSDDFSFGNGVTDSPFSVSVWFKLNGFNINNVLFSKDSGLPNREYAIGFFSGLTRLRFYIKDQGGNNQQSIDTTTLFAVGNWYNVVCTYDGSGGSNAADGLSIYVNSVKETPTNIIKGTYLAMSNTTAPVNIGRYGAAASIVRGKIDEVSVYDSELLQSDVDSIYSGGTPTTISGALAHYKMGEEANFTSNWLVDNSISPNRALKFDNTYITAPPWSGYQGLRASTTAISSNHITLSTWFKSTDSGNGQGQIFKTSLWDIKVYGNKVYLFKASALYRYWNSSDLFNGSWHNIIIYIPNTATWDLADAKIYVDSADLGAGTGINDGTGVPQITDIYGLFKTGSGGGGTMTAEISNWAYWLSDKRDEVSTIYNNGMPGDLSSLSPNVWWKLDSGTVTTDTQVDLIDSSGNNITGTGPRNAAKTIPALVSSTVNSRPPYSKRSFAFDGVDDKVSLASSINLGINSTISLWVNLESGFNGILLGENTYSYDYLMYAQENIAFYIRIAGTAVNYTNMYHPSGGIASGVWNNIVIQRTGDSIEAFLNGVSKGTNTGFGTVTDTMFDTLGDKPSGTFPIGGNIDEVAAWNNNTVNPVDIYNGGIPTTISGAIAHYRMGEDASFNGTNWTLPDNAGTSTGTSANMTVDDLVGEAPNYSGGGISANMNIFDRVGEAPNSSNNALSFNMDEVDRVEDTPS